MSLKFGWKVNEVRESIWKGDDAIPKLEDGRPDVPAAALASWKLDGDASWLLPYCTKGKPTIIRYRNLSPDEVAVASAPYISPTDPLEGWVRSVLLCFRIGVDFQGIETSRTADGAIFSVVVKERGINMLAEPFVTQLATDYPGIVTFYGSLILNGSFVTEKEKKASSPPSTATPSSAAASTAVTTEASPPAAAA